MKNESQDLCGNSISVLNNEQQNSSAQILPSNLKLCSSIPSKIHISCIHIHKNTLYLGTRNARILIYNIEDPDSNDILSEDEPFVLKNLKAILLHFHVISLVNADDNFFVFVPESDEESFVSIWSAKEKQFLTAYQGHTSQISQIVFMKYRNYVATSSWDCTVRIWPLYDFEKEETVKIFNGNYPILDLKEFNEDILVLGGDDCYLVFWNWKKNEIVKKEFGHAGSVMYIQMVNDLKIFTAGGDNKFKYWEICAVQGTEASREDVEMNFKSKYVTKKLQQIKEEYDSLVFGGTYDKHMILMDQQGELFLFVSEKVYFKLQNLFEYNENVSGIEVLGKWVIVVTSKGCVKYFSMKEEMKRLKFEVPEEQVLYSETNVLHISSDRAVDLEDDRPVNKKKLSQNQQA